MVPFHIEFQTSDVLRWPTLPEMTYKCLTQVPAMKEIEGTISEWWIRQSFQWPVDEKVPRSESSYSIIVKWERDKRSAVETKFHLSENCSEFFKCQLHTANYTSQMRFHAFHWSLPKATKIRSAFRNELPLYILCWTKLRNSILWPLVFQKCNKLFDVLSCTHRICPVVTPYKSRLPSLRNEVP